MKQGYMLCIGLGILAAGCASTGPSRETLLAMASVSKSSEQVGSVALNSKIINTTVQQQEDGFGGDYVIGAGDLLVVSVLDVSELDKVKVRVGIEGFIRLPLVGTIKVRGLTAHRLEGALADLLGEKYLYDPQVSVFIEEYKSQRVAVLGEVNKPGVYEVSERRTLIDMLALAGGLSKDADQVVYILRKSAGAETGPSNSGALLKIDLEQLLAGLDPSMNVKVSAGDVISVPKSGDFLLGGAVKKPGSYPIKGKLTVDQAIYFGEGLKEDADLTDIEVLRVSGSNNEVFRINVNQVKQEERPGLIIQKNDVVFVGTSGPKAALYGAIDFFKAVIRVGLSAGAAF
ncbi:MAG: SLBB domain-containing protein [candidate division NC10 bacterium]|nr:SLBB domain-containing protein [candidate division NC10 bacterium]